MATLTKISTSQRYNWLGRGRLLVSTALSEIQWLSWFLVGFAAARFLALMQGSDTISEGAGRGRGAWTILGRGPSVAKRLHFLQNGSSLLRNEGAYDYRIRA